MVVVAGVPEVGVLEVGVLEVGVLEVAVDEVGVLNGGGELVVGDEVMVVGVQLMPVTVAPGGTEIEDGDVPGGTSTVSVF